MIEKTGITVPNFRQVGRKRNAFVCRTQAGFKQALNKYNDDWKGNLVNYPRSYPCLVVFSQEYNGGGFNVRCTVISMNSLRDIIEQDKADNERLNDN